VSIAFYVVMTRISTNILTSTIGALGLMIAFYYGLTGFACVWFYRKVLGRSLSDFFNKGLLPLLGGTSLAGMFGYGCWYYYQPSNNSGGKVDLFGARIGTITFIGVATLLLGVVLMFVYYAIRPTYFRGETLTKRTALDVIGPTPARAGLTLPDSPSQEAFVVSPDPHVSGLTPEQTRQLVREVDPPAPADEEPTAEH
jgi:hypothetical protein